MLKFTLDSKDWNKHQHHRDPNFNHVVLHVCLFPPETASFMVATSETKLIPQLSLLSYLYQSLRNTMRSGRWHR